MNIVEWAFGKRMTPQEKLRKHQRGIEKTIRELEREKRKLEMQQKTVTNGIKKSAKDGEWNAVKLQAKDLARTRRYIEKFDQTRMRLQAISLQIQTVRTNEQMMQSMKGATKILSGMNRTMNLPQLSKIAMDFERENDIMDQRQEMMEDAVDDAVGMEDEDVESDEIINKVLDEIGVDLNMMMENAPTSVQAEAAPERRVAQAIGGGGGGTGGGGSASDDLQARFNSLGK